MSRHFQKVSSGRYDGFLLFFPTSTASKVVQALKAVQGQGLLSRYVRSFRTLTTPTCPGLTHLSAQI